MKFIYFEKSIFQSWNEFRRNAKLPYRSEKLLVELSMRIECVLCHMADKKNIQFNEKFMWGVNGFSHFAEKAREKKEGEKVVVEEEGPQKILSQAEERKKKTPMEFGMGLDKNRRNEFEN